MALKIPKKVKIGGLIYKISITDDLEDACAEIKSHKRLIQIKKADADIMELSFLHEILHGVNNEMPEEHVEFLAMALYQIIKDNPNIFKNGK